jgi:hypothetical protein
MTIYIAIYLSIYLFSTFLFIYFYLFTIYLSIYIIHVITNSSCKNYLIYIIIKLNIYIIIILNIYIYILGIITTIAGTGTGNYSGDGGLATSATLNSPFDVAFDPTTGDVYIADSSNHRIRLINKSPGIYIYASSYDLY